MADVSIDKNRLYIIANTAREVRVLEEAEQKNLCKRSVKAEALFEHVEGITWEVSK